MINQMNVLLVAEEAVGAHALVLLSNSQHHISAVLTTPDNPRVDESKFGRGRIIPLNRESEKSTITSIAKRVEVPVLDARRVTDPNFSVWMKSHHIDILLNVHSLHRICPEILQSVRVGAFNLHPGPLPRYSGLNVPSWAVYNQESSHAVTIHHITDEVDAGHIVYESRFPLTSKDTGLTVSLTCVKRGLELLERLLSELSSDPLSVPSIHQDLGQRILYKRNQIPGQGFIQWTDSADKIDAFVRACNYSPFRSPWGEAKTRWNNDEISILKTEVSNEVSKVAPGTVGKKIQGKTAISTSDYWILIDKCKLNGESVRSDTFLTPGEKLVSGLPH